MAHKFGQGVTDRQMKLARAFERAGLTSFSQAVKAFQRRNEKQIAEWKAELAKLAELEEMEKGAK